jgi:hypothetical protein
MDMAQLHGNGWSQDRSQRRQMTSLERWNVQECDESATARPIELRGSIYLAFCKRWAPQWIDDEDELN